MYRISIKQLLELTRCYRDKHSSDSYLKMHTWFLFILFVAFVWCDGFQFNVSRGAQGNGRDTFSNMDPSGKCPRTNDNGRDWCLAKYAECSLQGCCICACKYDYSTFRMASSIDSATCVRNNVWRKFAGCTQKFAGMSDSQPLMTLNLQMKGFIGVTGLPASKCVIKSVLYLHQGTWSYLHSSLKNTFDIEKSGTSWPTQKLTWDKNLTFSYFGYIMKINAECSIGKGSKKSFCVVFKSNGTISWNVTDPATEDPHIISTSPAATTKILTTKATVTTEVKSTRKVVPTTVTTIKATSTEPLPQQLTTREITGKKVASKTLPKTAKLTKSFAESTVIAIPQTEALSVEVTTAEPTYNTGSRDKLSGTEEREHDTLMIALIAGGAAVICMAVVFLCIWLIVSQRRKNRFAVSYDAGTTVITNPTTGLQNHFPMPGLVKNPVFDDSVYAEPEKGQPSYEIPQDLLVRNPGASDARSSPPLNNIRTNPLKTTSIKIVREHTYDSMEQMTRGKLQDKAKPFYDNPEYLLNGENSACHSLVKESNVDTYQSLDPGRLMYQPLKNIVPKCKYEIPEYLALLNPNETSSNASPSPPEYQPPYSTGPPPEDFEEHPEYADYADLDELEEIAAKEGSNKCSNEDPCYEVPVDNVPQAPTYDYALPGGVVPDRPDLDSSNFTNQGYEPPLYAVLEGPDTAP